MWIVISLCALAVIGGGAGILLLTRFPLRFHGPGARQRRKDFMKSGKRTP
ncbi:hypothetical protein CLV63_105164 [Murinocardiopsis flavida]|uniref:Uncharacterized protein n=1 Tax=Murinocardiopsis flavida TaxID=645275 RepID=A0A2P8DMP5_9ACTN|nr:hypothetical protein [Murinocardiopsis flavida]PSK98490.1 hypothetical protein CLV63_105164 [Murinocardiopsis flavida]